MGASKDLMFRMREEEYLEIPDHVRNAYLTSKRVDVEIDDWAENMKDELFAKLYKQKKEVSKQLSEREYQLRELRRKNK